MIRRWDAITGESLGDLGQGEDPILFHLNGTTMMAAAGSEGVLVRPLEGELGLVRGR